MTREHLQSLGLTDEQQQAVLEAHASALRAAEEPHLRRLLAEALCRRGASPDAARLLAGQHPLEGLAVSADGELTGAAEAVESLAAGWSGLFAAVGEMNPPAAAASALALPEDLSRMSAEEINARWSEVKAALASR